MSLESKKAEKLKIRTYQLDLIFEEAECK